jgi:putative ABC transport system substrate-binding protein
MNRRTLLKLIALGALPASAAAQQPAKVWRIGFLYGGLRQSALDTGRYRAFLQGMRELGYVENKNFTLIERYSPNAESALPAAQEVLNAQPDVVLVSGGTSLQALRKLTTTVPVVVAVSTDPLGQGIAENLARPGKNFTGFAAFTADLFPKHVQLIKAALPRMSRLGILTNPQNPDHAALEKSVATAANDYGMRVHLMKVSAFREFEPAFAELKRQKAEALLILGDVFFVQYFRQIAELCIKHRVISSYSSREYPDLGGFLSYGPNFRDHYRGAAKFIDKILKGAKAGDLPFEQPTKLQLVINRSTAKALGMRIPDELVLRADAMID